MNAFEERFSFLAIVLVLANLRAKEAGLRHRKVFYWRHFGGDSDPGLTKISDVSALLPPRRQWSRPNRKMRGGKGRPLAQILRDAIYRKVMKFFDTVGHDVVRAETAKMLSKVEGGDTFLRLLDGYLSSYSLGWMLDEGRKLVVHENYVLDLVDVARISALHEGRVVDLERLGMPQGGALSGTLANVILNLEQVKAPIHPVQRTVSYGAGYYEAKSKGPYAWERQTPQTRNAVPWVSFLGCCVRYDGELRIRKETVLGHAQSMAEECETFCKRVKAVRNTAGRHTDGVWYEDAVRGLMYRLVDKGVGRVTGTTGHGIGYCWLAAFPIVWMSPPAQQQLRRLDRIRTDLFTAVKCELGLMLKKGDPTSGEEPSLYFGKPFSYAGIAERLVRAQVARLRTVTFDVMPVPDSQDFITHDGDQNEPYEWLDDERENDYDQPDFDPASDWERASGR